jgi:quinolinate synthase
MKMTTLPKVLHALERMQHRITVAPEVAARARLALERMVSIGGNPATAPSGDPGE